MDDVEGRVSLKIDLATGTIELDAPASSFNEAIEKTKELAATLDLKNRRSTPQSSEQTTGSTVSTGASANEAVTPPPSPARATRAKNGKSSGRVGRLGSYEPIAKLLTEEQEIELRAFFTEKSPSEQSDRALVAMLKGEHLLGRKGFTYNEIYTLMWLGGVKDLPKALDVVLGKMIQEQTIIKEGAGFSTKFIGRNRVENDLPKRDTK
jgi:hypothetical protein